MSELHVVLGASGGAGSAITSVLTAARQLRVRAVTRRPAHPAAEAAPGRVEHLTADITDPVGATSAVRGASVVYLAAQPDYTRWAAEFPPMLDAVITATAEVGAKLVVVDNLYAYGPAGDAPMREASPALASDTKGRVRAAMTRHLLAASAAGDLRVTIGRAADFFGPGVHNSGISVLAFEPLASARRRLRWLGRGDVPHSTAYIPDIARALVVLGTDERADGQVWHLPHEPAITGREFLALVNTALPSPRRTSIITPWMIRAAALFSPMIAETRGILHQWDRPFVVDDTAFRSTFGFQGTPLPQAVAATVAAFAPSVRDPLVEVSS